LASCSSAARSTDYDKEYSNMPVVNNSQARIELSKEQALALVEFITEPDEGGAGPLPPVFFIEETNLGSTVAVGGKGIPWALIEHGGDTHYISQPKGQSKGSIQEINSVPCPDCGAAVGEPCKSSSSGRPIRGWHKLRTRAAR
jgi:hypothetical protein